MPAPPSGETYVKVKANMLKNLLNAKTPPRREVGTGLGGVPGAKALRTYIYEKRRLAMRYPGG